MRKKDLKKQDLKKCGCSRYFLQTLQNEVFAYCADLAGPSFNYIERFGNRQAMETYVNEKLSKHYRRPFERFVLQIVIASTLDKLEDCCFLIWDVEFCKEQNRKYKF